MLPPRFVFAIVVAVSGASLLYGFNTSVVNTPATNIQNWYATCYAIRAGVWPVAASANNTSAASTAIPQVTNISVLWSVTTSIYFLAGMISAFCFGRISDTIGRKTTLLINNALAIIAAVCFLVCFQICSPELLIIGRFIIGLNCGVGLGLCPLYLSELATKSLRGPVTASSYLGCSIGLFLAQVLGLSPVLGSPTTWPYCLALTAIPAIFQLCLLPICPESPRFLLINKNDEEGARKAFVWLYGEEEGEAEFRSLLTELHRRSKISQHKLASLASMKNVLSNKSMQKITSSLQVQAQASGLDLTKMVAQANLPVPTSPAPSNVETLAKRRKSSTNKPEIASPAVSQGALSLKVFFTDRQYSLPLFIGIVCHIAQQWSGINAVFTYSGTIFKGIGLPSNVTQYCTLATGGSSVVSVICCIPLFSKVGRRTLVLVSISIMCFGLLLLVISGATGSIEPAMNYVGIIAVIIFIFGYAPIGTTPPVLVSEMFLQNARGLAFSIAIAVRWGSNIVILFAFPYMMAALGPYTFLVFFGIMLACLAGLALYLPETKGKPLMEIHDMVSHGFDHMQVHLHSVDMDHIAYHLHMHMPKRHQDVTDGTQTDDPYVENGAYMSANMNSNQISSVNDLSGLELHKLGSQNNFGSPSQNGKSRLNSTATASMPQNGNASANLSPQNDTKTNPKLDDELANGAVVVNSSANLAPTYDNNSGGETGNGVVAVDMENGDLHKDADADAEAKANATENEKF